MLLGGLFGFAGLQIPLMETGIAGSVLAFGLLIEVLQIGTRHTASLFDLLADLAGVATYLLLRQGYRKWEQLR